MRGLRAAGTTAALSFAGLSAHGLHIGPAPPVSVIPIPNAIVPRHGSFTFDSATIIRTQAHDPEARSAADYFVDLMTRSKRPIPSIVSGSDITGKVRPAVTFRRRAGLGAEAYEIDISPHGIVILATSGTGLFYGAVTLWQLLTPGSGPITIPAQLIRDAPAYPWRGLMLDSVRHFQSAEVVRSMIDAMALHKLNVLHWHLTDDQGWRLEILKYARLTSIGAWRTPATFSPHEPAPPSPYGGFYTQTEVRGIVAYAASRHVRIIPEIEMPGHAQAAIAAYPELGVSDARPGGVPLAVSAKWGVHAHLFNIEPATFEFLENVLAEVMDLFPDASIHVGGDEAIKDEWKASPSVQARAGALGIEDADDLQAYFTQEIGRYLNVHGRRLIGWDEILRPGLSKEAIVMSWRGTAGAHAAAVLGNDTVLSPWPTLYFDNRQSSLATEPTGRLNVVSLEDVYRFEPRDPALGPSATGHVLGIQANLWTEHIRTEENLQWMTWPRAAAVAELGWSVPTRRDWPDFLRRLVPMFERYAAINLTYADSAFAPAARLVRGDDAVTLTLSNQAAFGEIRYTLDGLDPTVNSAPYTAPLTLRTDTEIRAATFVQSVRVSRVWARRFDAHGMARRDSHELELCSDGIGLLLEPEPDSASRAPPLAVDIMNPCWIYRGVDLDRPRPITAAVAPLPFNYELGADAEKIRVGDARTAGGELEIHVDGCETPPVAILPLARAERNAVTKLPPIALAPRTGRHDLCVRFARAQLDPLWALDWIEIGE
ncbi:MAG: beta-hexosaminidase [Gammaproteobacteria bacterium]|nr:beta-hexosaminidase [Gammaproteobacteria bacterium]